MTARKRQPSASSAKRVRQASSDAPSGPVRISIPKEAGDELHFYTGGEQFDYPVEGGAVSVRPDHVDIVLGHISGSRLQGSEPEPPPDPRPDPGQEDDPDASQHPL